MILIHWQELCGFYSLGLNMTYHQIPMHKSDEVKTAFAILYFDYIFVHSRDFEYFYSTFSIRSIKETALKLKAKKCTFL